MLFHLISTKKWREHEIISDFIQYIFFHSINFNLGGYYFFYIIMILSFLKYFNYFLYSDFMIAFKCFSYSC